MKASKLIEEPQNEIEAYGDFEILMKNFRKLLGLKNAEVINLRIGVEEVIITSPNGTFSKNRIHKICTTVADVLNVHPSCIRYDEYEKWWE